MFGRLRRQASHHEDNDVLIDLQVMCDLTGTGSSTHEVTEVINSCPFRDKKRIALPGTTVIIGECLMRSEKEEDREKGLEMIESVAKEGSVFGMLSLALMNEFGLNGMKKDEIRAKDLCKLCAEKGFSEASRRLDSVGVGKSDLQPKRVKEWNSFLYRVKHNSVFEARLSGQSKHFFEVKIR